MGKLTNLYGVHNAIYEAVIAKESGYDSHDGVMSITTLLSPPRIVELGRIHKDQITEDVSDKIYTLLGSIIHGILDGYDSDAIKEQRYFSEKYGTKISGKIDTFKNGKLSDFKFQTVYKVKNGEASEEQVAQLNCYAQLLRDNGLDVKELEIVSIFRDWSKNDAAKEPSYPQKQTLNIKVPLWTAERCEAFLRERVRLHTEAHTVLPECTASERWARPDIWAIHKKGRFSAIKLHEAEANAKNHLALLDKDHYIEFRAGKSIRCESWCAVAQFCSQKKRMDEQKK